MDPLTREEVTAPSSRVAAGQGLRNQQRRQQLMKTGGSGAMFNTGAAARGGSPHKFGDQRYASSSCAAGVLKRHGRPPPGAAHTDQPQRGRRAPHARSARGNRRKHKPRAPPPPRRDRRAHAKPHSRRSLIDGVEGGPSKPCEAPVSATLVLKDGQRLEGTSFGAKVNRPGEVVFNTGMVRVSVKNELKRDVAAATPSLRRRVASTPSS